MLFEEIQVNVNTGINKCILFHYNIYSCLKWPAAAVTPAPRVYIKVVAVKKLVVGLEGFI